MEKTVQSKIIKYLEKKGAWVVKIISCNKNGCPDLLVCYKGKFYGFEVKRSDGRGKVSPLQIYRIKQINDCGGKAYVVKSVEEVKKIL